MLDDLDRAVFDIIGDFGNLVTYVKRTPGAYNPATASVAQVETQTTVEGVVMDLTLNRNGLTTKHGTDIVAGDKQLYIRPPRNPDGTTALTVDPSSDVVIVAGTQFKIVTYKEVNPTGNAAILYILYLRR